MKIDTNLIGINIYKLNYILPFRLWREGYLRLNLLIVTDERIIRAFGKVLKEMREANGVSQEELAHAIKSHATHISRLENGHKQPTLVTFFKIAEKLEVDPEVLVTKIKALG